MSGWSDLVVAGSGKADAPQPDLFEARTRATVRYADPAAWTAATAVARALSESKDSLLPSSHDIGMVMVSDHGPVASMADINAVTPSGFSSPLRYAASNPGSLVGVSCIAFGLRGPTINLTMLPNDGVPVGLQLCANWLNRQAARWMVLATFTANGLQDRRSRALLLGHSARGAGTPLTQTVTNWLLQVGRE